MTTPTDPEETTTRQETAMPESTNTTEIQKRQRTLFSRASDDVLFGAVSMLELKADSGTPLTAEETITRALILGEVESRYPETDAAMDRWAESDAPARTYSAHLFAEVGRIKAERARRAAALASAQREERAARVARVRMLADRYPGRVHLISCGSAVAIPAGEIKAGDTLVYNYGSTAVVLRVEPTGKASVVIVTSEGEYGSRTCRRGTLVAIADRPDANL